MPQVFMRSSVEELSTQLETTRGEARSRVRALRSQRADLQARMRAEEIRLAQLQARISEQREQLTEDTDAAALTEALLASSTALAGSIERSLPFRRDERLQALLELTRQVESGELTPETGVARVWEVVEDEFRLGREVGVQRQSIELDGEELLAEVAHIGLYSLYFRTLDGRYGMARLEGSTWRFVELEGRNVQVQLTDLFDSFRKNVREGWFGLPGGLRGLE